MSRSGHCGRGQALWTREVMQSVVPRQILHPRESFQADTRARICMLRDTWIQRKKHGDGRSNAHRLESGVCGDKKCGAFKIRALRDTLGWSQRPPHDEGERMYYFFHFFNANQLKLVSRQRRRGRLDVRNSAWVPLRRRSAPWSPMSCVYTYYEVCVYHVHRLLQIIKEKGGGSSLEKSSVLWHQLSSGIFFHSRKKRDDPGVKHLGKREKIRLFNLWPGGPRTVRVKFANSVTPPTPPPLLISHSAHFLRGCPLFPRKT